MLEAHIEKLERDPEIVDLIREQILKDYPKDAQSLFETAETSDGGDLELLYLKMCDD